MSIRLGLNISVSPRSLFAAFTAPAIAKLLFSNDEPGVFYDFDDWSTLFQDTAGTQPVTAANQGVALALDKSGNDNHATQATTAARPLTVIHPDGGVRNLLDRSEEFDNAVWNFVSGSGTITSAPSEPSPTGSTGPVYRLQGTAGSWFFAQNIAQAIGVGLNLSFYVKSASGSFQTFRLAGNGGVAGFVTANVTATTSWQRFDVSGTTSFDTARAYGILRDSANNAADLYIAFPQLEEGSEPTPYQKRVNFLDVTEAGKRSIRRLYFNGTSHFMTTPVITPNTDKAQVFAGVRKLSSAVNVVLELSSNSLDDNGSLGVFAPNIPSGDPFGFGSRGTVRSLAANGPYAPPITSILTGLGDISGDLAALRIDGAQVAQNTDDQGTGNYLAYQMFIGARAGTSLFFNGYLDQLITRFGANLDTGAIGTTEKYVSTKSPELVAASEVTWNASTDTYTQNLVGLGR
jgi:hypothetical protein